MSIGQTHGWVPNNHHTGIHSYGVSEVRDGFFDALFLKGPPVEKDEVIDQETAALPVGFEKSHPLSPKAFFPRQVHELRSVVRRVTTTRAGIKLLKSFTAFFIAYVLCLVPAIRDWLGRYDYFMVVSIIINHPARTFGSQVDGAVLTVLGAVCGLAWGTLGLLLSTCTPAASAGYGGILAMFLALFMAATSYIRSFFIRFYQAVLAAGIAVAFTTLAEVGPQTIQWDKLRNYAVPWLLGQAIALVVNVVLFPDAGNRPLAVVIDNSFRTMQEALLIPRPRNTMLRRRLNRTFMDIALAYRDMRLDITVTRFHPTDVRELRNLVQGVVRAFLSMETDTQLFEDWNAEDEPIATKQSSKASAVRMTAEFQDLSRQVANSLSGPTREVLQSMAEGMSRCHAALMNVSSCRQYFGPEPEISSDIPPALARLKIALDAFDLVESRLLGSNDTPESYSEHPETVKLFVFTRHVREAAAMLVNLMVKVDEIASRSNHWRLNLPSYPLSKAISRTNAQVRHDRSGVTAGIDKLGYRIWTIIHRLQGFESRFALKVAIVTSLLAIPAWLYENYNWWNNYEAWWAACMGWIMMHPRVGGNVQDLITRAFVAILGAAWAGASYAAADGNPYVMAVFAAIYMIPMLFRFTQSSHPRSGLVGCLSFTVVSLSLRDHVGPSSVALIAIYKGLAFFIGTIAPIIVNWILWPFVARHELRYALSSMLFFMSTIYRNVVANYVYFDEGEDPTPDDVTRSEMLESRMREGFVRIRQLLVMTRHEPRLRAPFDPLPYAALAAACERFFEYLIAVRQSALFYNPNFIRDNPVAADKLLHYRRDAVATILGNLYILAGALRAQRKVPRYLPSAAAARKRLTLKTAEVSKEMAGSPEYCQLERQKTWSDIYSYSYNESLTGCVAQLEELEKFTKIIVGEKAFEGTFKDMEDSDDEPDTPPNERR
ncbi:hypothetical protein BGZ63DRAFT_410626 [Mariannaea sp. PMI_226]|nr:hypothetical protein BGZ63DRAFT_410626 [Mariannaea sp. PMI_226]